MHMSWWAQCNHKGSSKREARRWERLTVLNQVTGMTIRLVAGTTRELCPLALQMRCSQSMDTHHHLDPSPRKAERTGKGAPVTTATAGEAERAACSVYSVGLVSIEGVGQETGKPAKQRVSSA